MHRRGTHPPLSRLKTWTQTTPEDANPGAMTLSCNETSRYLSRYSHKAKKRVRIISHDLFSVQIGRSPKCCVDWSESANELEQGSSPCGSPQPFGRNSAGPVGPPTPGPGRAGRRPMDRRCRYASQSHHAGSWCTLPSHPQRRAAKLQCSAAASLRPAGHSSV